MILLRYKSDHVTSKKIKSELNSVRFIRSHHLALAKSLASTSVSHPHPRFHAVNSFQSSPTVKTSFVVHFLST